MEILEPSDDGGSIFFRSVCNRLQNETLVHSAYDILFISLLQEPATDLVLIQLNPIHILTLSAFQHAVLTGNIPCAVTLSATDIDIKIDHSVLQPVT